MSVCGICGGANVRALFNAADVNHRTTEEVFTIERCLDCGVAQTSPRPDALALKRYYPTSYYPQAEPARDRYQKKVGRYQKDKLAIVQRHRSAGRLLDVGCGAGYFVREALESGFEAEGIEFSEETAGIGRRLWGLRIAVGDVAQAGYQDGSFDVVTLWQVLEHLPQPARSLEHFRRLLRPGGILVIAVPNLSSVQARFFRGRWYHLDVPRHLFHFDPPSLRSLLHRNGFSVLNEDHHSPEHNWAGILGSILPLSTPGMSLPGAALRRFVGRPLARCLAGIESSLGAGGTFTVCAGKRE